MKHFISNGLRLGALAAMVASTSAQASDLFSLDALMGNPLKVIYGADNRLDLYQVNNPTYRTLADSTAALFEASNISTTNDTTVLRTAQYGQSMGLCRTEPFFEQPVGAFCSGSLVGPDLLMTAGHCIRSQATCESTNFVFGFGINDAQANPSQVPAGEVYKCKEVVTTYQNNSGADYALVRLDRAVNNHAPLKINRNTDLAPGAPIVVIGHPSGLPTKVADGANVRSINSGYFQANLDTYGGNSGSAVFNSDTGLVEGILVRGETDFTYSGGCRVSYQCTDTGCRGEDVTSIGALAKMIPELTE